MLSRPVAGGGDISPQRPIGMRQCLRRIARHVGRLVGGVEEAEIVDDDINPLRKTSAPLRCGRDRWRPRRTRIAAPGARSWMISIIRGALIAARQAAGRRTRAPPPAWALRPDPARPPKPRTPSEMTAIRTPDPSTPNRCRAASAPSCRSPSVTTAPAADDAVGRRRDSTARLTGAGASPDSSRPIQPCTRLKASERSSSWKPAAASSPSVGALSERTTSMWMSGEASTDLVGGGATIQANQQAAATAASVHSDRPISRRLSPTRSRCCGRLDV